MTFSQLTANFNQAIEAAQSLSDVKQSPVGVWSRDGWFGWTDVEPEMVEDENHGWELVAVVDPYGDGEAAEGLS